MAFNVLRYGVGIALMTREGTPEEDARQRALFPAIVEAPLPQTMLMSIAMGRAGAGPATAPGPVDEPAGEPGGTEPDAKYVRVPDVRGRPIEEAIATLARRGLEADLHEVVVDEGEDGDGDVIDQLPKVDSWTRLGSTVVLLVAPKDAEAEFVEVPDVVGQPPAEGARELRRFGLEPVLAKVLTVEQRDGVVEQDPPAGIVRRGETVVLFVSSAQAQPVEEREGHDGDEAGDREQYQAARADAQQPADV